MRFRFFPPGNYRDYGGNLLPGKTALSVVVVSAAFAASLTLDATAYAAYETVIFDTTLTANVTAFAITGAFDGQSLIWRARQDGTGGRTWAPGASIGFSTDIPSVTLSPAASKLDYIAFRWSSTDSKAHVTARNLGF